MRRRPIPLLPLCLLAAASLRAQAAAPQNLLDNGGGDSPVAIRLGTDRGLAFFDLPGWSVDAGEWVAQATGWGKIASVDGGTFLRPSRGDAPALHQDVRVDALGTERPTHLIASAWLRTGKDDDRIELRLALCDAAFAELAEPPPAAAEVHKESGWTWRHIVVPVPAGTVFARVGLRAVRRDGKWLDGYADAACLEAFGPGHPRDLAKLSQKQLIDALGAAPEGLGAERRAVLRALAASGNRGAEVVRAQLAAAAAPAERAYLLTLLVLSGHGAVRDAVEQAIRGGSPAERDRAFELLGLARFDWRRLLGAIARGNGDGAGDAELRRRAIERLARAADAPALEQLLAVARAGDVEGKIEVLRALGDAPVDPDAIYRAFLAPHLAAEADAALRHEAMRALSALRDERYLRHLAQLFAEESDRGRRGAWFGWCAAFDSVAALEVMVRLCADGVARAPGAFLAVVPGMSSAPVGAWLERRGLSHEVPIVRRASIEHLRRHGGPGDAPALAALCKDRDPQVAVAAVEAFSELGGASVRPELERLLTAPRGRVAAAALRALFALGSMDAEVLLEAAADARAFEVRAAAIDLLALSQPDRARAAFVSAFEDPAPQVRAAAYAAMQRVRDRASIEALLARLPRERGTTKHFLLEALTDLTGIDQGDDPATWQKWWSIVGAAFVLPPPGQARRADPAAAAAAAGAAGRTTTSYYGIPIRSDNLVFVIDLSGSMGTKVDGVTKLQAAKDELIAVLRLLDRHKRFSLIAFSDGPRLYAKELVEASADEVEKAVQWIGKLKVGGWTNIFDSVARALELPGVESVFLLSDGGPSVGEYVDMDAIRRVVRGRNRELRVRVNTIAIGGSKNARKFLRLLADENHGVNRDR